MRWATRRMGSAVLAVVLVGVLAGCNEIVVGPDGVRSSAASRAVDPVTLTVAGRRVPGIDIRMRDCQHVRLERDDGDPITLRLTPRAHVVDAAGNVFFDNGPPELGPGVRPPGSSEVTADDSPDGAHHIRVAVADARMPLTITMACDRYAPGSRGIHPLWRFPTCRTSTRRCNATAPGTGEWSF